MDLSSKSCPPQTPFTSQPVLRVRRCTARAERVAGGCMHGASRVAIRALRAAGRAAAVRV
eukprot:1828236-Prymnesium_polylepis.1